jgi:Fatty-acid desaturase
MFVLATAGFLLSCFPSLFDKRYVHVEVQVCIDNIGPRPPLVPNNNSCFKPFFGPSCFSILNWVRDHRLHHKYTDTDADPHNSTRGFFFSHIGWSLILPHPEVTEKVKVIDTSDVEKDWVVVWQYK